MQSRVRQLVTQLAGRSFDRSIVRSVAPTTAQASLHNACQKFLSITFPAAAEHRKSTPRFMCIFYYVTRLLTTSLSNPLYRRVNWVNEKEKFQFLAYVQHICRRWCWYAWIQFKRSIDQLKGNGEERVNGTHLNSISSCNAIHDAFE